MMLLLKSVELGYGHIVAVKGVSLRVAQGQVVSLIGANGAGKTTILRGLSGLLPPRSGRIELAGRDITALPAHKIARLGMAHVPEGRQVFGSMSVAENLAMGGYLAPGRAELARRMDEVLALFPRLGERRSQAAGLLSGGEQQMLAMGRALMAAPRLLLLDEPSMGLAPLIVAEVYRLIRHLKEAGKTILLVEQNARLALEIADYAYVLETGRIRLKGPAARLAADPQVLAAYLGGHP